MWLAISRLDAVARPARTSCGLTASHSSEVAAHSKSSCTNFPVVSSDIRMHTIVKWRYWSCPVYDLADHGPCSNVRIGLSERAGGTFSGPLRSSFSSSINSRLHPAVASSM